MSKAVSKRDPKPLNTNIWMENVMVNLQRTVWSGRNFLMSMIVSMACLSSAVSAEANRPPILLGLDAEFGHLTSTSDDAIKMGMLTAMDEINSAGGLLGGRRLQLVELDSRSVPARGVENFRQFAAMKDLVSVFVGKFSPVTLEQAPLANSLKLPLLNPWSAADDIIDLKPAGTYTFRLSLRDSWAMPAMLAYLKGRGFSRVGVLLPTSSWGRSNETLVKKHMDSNSLPTIVGSQWYNWGIKTLQPQLEKLVLAKADAILFVGNEGEGSLLVREMAEWPELARLPIVSHWGVSGGNFIELSGPSLAKVDFAVVQTFTFNGRDDAKAKAVVARAAKLFKIRTADDIPSQVGFAHAYDLTHILARAVTLAGTTDRVAVRAALERVKDYAGLMGRFAQPFSATNHEALSARNVFIGRFTPAGSVEAIRR